MPKIRKGPPIQVIIIVGISLGLMFLSWYSISSSAFQEKAKARQTADFFLEAIGRVPAKDLGKYLYDDVRRSYTHDTLAQRLNELGLNKPLEIGQWSDEQESLNQWRWRVGVTQEEANFDLLVYVRKPEKMSMARRWQTYTLCRPQADLSEILAPVLETTEAPGSGTSASPQMNALWAALKAAQFVPEDMNLWKIVAYEPLLKMMVPGKKDQKLSLEWQVSPQDHLQCRYDFQNFKLSENLHNGTSGQGTMDQKDNGDGL